MLCLLVKVLQHADVFFSNRTVRTETVCGKALCVKDALSVAGGQPIGPEQVCTISETIAVDILFMILYVDLMM